MKILIVYASNSGSTFQVGEIIARTLEKKHTVLMKSARQTTPEEFTEFACVLLGSPSWSVAGQDGSPSEAMLALIQKTQRLSLKFSGKPFALFGCGDNSYTYFCGAVDYLEKFVKTAGGRIIIPSLRIDSFYFDLEKSFKQAAEWSQELLTNLK